MPNNPRAARRRKPSDFKISSKVLNLDVAAQKLLSTVDAGYTERELLSDKDSTIQAIINSELELSKGVSHGSIIDFVTLMSKESARHNGLDENQVDSYNLFTEDIGNLFGYFQEMYKNRYIELADLKFITKFIPAIGEAVKTTLDSIVSSDDFSTSIAHNLEFHGALTDTERAAVEAEITRIEKDEKLLKKLRNTVYKKALVSGTHYVYCIPYAELFSEYDRLVKEGRIRDNMLVNNAIARANQTRAEKEAGFVLNAKDKSFLGKYAGASESTMDATATMPQTGFDPAMKSIMDSALESFYAEDDPEFKKDMKTYSLYKNDFQSSLENAFLNCYAVNDTDVLVEALEGFSSAEFMREKLTGYRELFAGNAVLEDKSIQTTDATAGLANMTGKPERFHTLGSYIKYIDANRLVPIKVYNQVVGYFHVHDMSARKKANTIQSGISQTNLITSTSNIFSSVSVADDTRQRATQAIVDAISDGIVTNFSNRFVNKHADFKKLIADCIVANGFVNEAFQIQFIPAKYIIAFPVNEDEDGIGQSILQDALFPAKMLLSVLVSKLLLYMNKSGNRTIAYVRKGPIDRSGSNQIQRVIRMLQESNITFSDLLSTNLSFSKFSRYGNIQLPMAKNGDHLIDFETQEGQEVDMHTPMEEYLEKLAIMGTGVPSVILEYTDAADYAKSLVTANMKFAGRVASLQADLEEPTTELYQRLIETSNLDDDLKKKVVNAFEFKLCRPRVLTNMNMSDYVGQMENLTSSIANIFLGEGDETPEDTKVRRKFRMKMAADFLPFVSWDDYEKMLQDVRVDLAGETDLDKTEPAEFGEGEEEY